MAGGWWRHSGVFHCSSSNLKSIWKFTFIFVLFFYPFCVFPVKCTVQFQCRHYLPILIIQTYFCKLWAWRRVIPIFMVNFCPSNSNFCLRWLKVWIWGAAGRHSDNSWISSKWSRFIFSLQLPTRPKIMEPIQKHTWEDFFFFFRIHGWQKMMDALFHFDVSILASLHKQNKHTHTYLSWRRYAPRSVHFDLWLVPVLSLWSRDCDPHRKPAENPETFVAALPF